MSTKTKPAAADFAGKTVLTSEAVPIDGDCTGVRWRATNTSTLARLIAMMAMGQAAYAAHILATLSPAPAATRSPATDRDHEGIPTLVGLREST